MNEYEYALLYGEWVDEREDRDGWPPEREEYGGDDRIYHTLS